MLDLLDAVTLITLFALSLLYVRSCDRLKGIQ